MGFSQPPPGFSAESWQQLQGAYSQAEQDPAYAAAAQQKADQLNAYRSAQTASMGMMTGKDFSTAAADPSTAFQRFSQSGYTPQQALSDGWATGVGNPGWQGMAGYQAPLNPQGMMGAPYAQQQIQQYQAANVAAQNRNGWGAAASTSSPQINQSAQPYYNQGVGAGGQSQDFWKAQLGSSFDQNAWNMAHGGGSGTPSASAPAQQAYGQAPLRQGIYQQLNGMLAGGGQNPFAQQQSYSQAAPRMQTSSGVPSGGYGQRQSSMGQSPAWQSFLSNLKPAAGF